MTLARYRVHDAWSLEDLFGKGQWCPICGCEEFTVYEGMGITCDDCGARFSVDHTGGDPGCVIRCDPFEEKYTLALTPIIDSAKEYGHEFWQVLKPCDGGLETLGCWCSRTPGFYLKRGEPVGQEVVFYRPSRVAHALAWAEWRSSPRGIEACAHVDADYGMYQRMRTEDAPARHQRQDEFESQLLEWGMEPGYYVRSQCSYVFEDDGMWIHSCFPNPDAKPVRGVS